jgi:uncharacterized membrane protein YeaQ/YmgE (transglycosylase-associated protein family)
MLHYFALDNYSDELLLVMGISVVLGAVVIGFVTDMLMADRGFGAFGNGMLAVVGCFIGLYVQNAYFGHANVNQLLLTGVMAAGTATGLLLTLGIVKHFVSD